mgnify:CR=1 FL=1
MLAGDVSVELIDGILRVLGDREANSIVIEQTGLESGKFRILGVAGTTVNGQSEMVFNGVAGLSSVTGWGDDSVTVRNCLDAVDMRVRLGAGNDSLEILDGAAGRVRIVAGAGDDLVTIDTVDAKRFGIRAGRGDDRVEADASGHVVVRLGDRKSVV